MKKQDVIILHGWNLAGNRFTPLADVFLSRGFRVFTPDFPGFGSEPAPKNPWHVVDYAEFLKTYMGKNHIHSPVLVGHSFGGRVALKFSHIYPGELKALILTGTPGFSPVPTKKLVFFMALSKVGGLLFALPVLHVLADYARRFLYYVAGSRDFLRAEGTMRQTFKNIVRDDLLPAMESVSVPCLLLWGEFDVMVPLIIGQRMQQAIPNATIKVIPESDHSVPFKQPDIFASYVVAFLEANRIV